MSEIVYLHFVSQQILFMYKLIFYLNLTYREAVLFTSSQNRCACGNCQVMGRVEVCVCCREIKAVQNKNNEAATGGECEDPPQCITQHPGFHVVCINTDVDVYCKLPGTSTNSSIKLPTTVEKTSFSNTFL